MLTPAERSAYIDNIRALPAQVEAVIDGLTDEQLTHPFLDNEWSVAQIVHHLADSHMNSFIRLKLLLTEDHPTLRPYDQAAWAVMVDETGLPLQPSLTILRGLHQRWVMVFESLSPEEWQQTAYHPEIGDLTAEDLLQFYVAHGQDHLAQIERVLAAGQR